MIAVKRCSHCEASKPVEEFGKRAASKDGLYYVCKACVAERDRARYEAAKLSPGVCELEDCEKSTFLDRYCRTHRQRIANHGDPDIVAHRRGPDNHAWTGEAATYKAVHHRVRAARGKASDHPCEVESCTAQAVDWAYDYGDPDEREEVLRGYKNPSPYSLDVDRYHPLCKLCHRRADSAIRRVQRGRTEESAEFERQLAELEEWIAVKYAVAA